MKIRKIRIDILIRYSFEKIFFSNISVILNLNRKKNTFNSLFCNLGERVVKDKSIVQEFMLCPIIKKYFPLIFQRSKGIISDSSRLLVLSSKHHNGRGFLAPVCTAGPNVKNMPKIRFKKFVKLTDHTRACNDLTNFAYVVHEITGNGSYVKLQKLARKNKKQKEASSTTFK